MEKSNLLDAVGLYCKTQNFQKTLTALYRATDNNKKSADLSEIFEKYFNKQNGRQGLSFTFNLQNRRSQLRKRLLDNPSEAKVSRKKIKLGSVKDAKNDIPDNFLLLLDELELDRKDAKLLYENKDQWTYVKSDRLLDCFVKGNTSI